MASKITLRSWFWDKKVIRAQYFWVDFHKNGHFVIKNTLRNPQSWKKLKWKSYWYCSLLFLRNFEKTQIYNGHFILPKFTKSDIDVVNFFFNSCGYQKHSYLMLIFQNVNDSRGKKSDKDRQRNWECKIEFYTCFFQFFSRTK